jgi:hypothetical protein
MTNPTHFILKTEAVYTSETSKGCVRDIDRQIRAAAEGCSFGSTRHKVVQISKLRNRTTNSAVRDSESAELKLVSRFMAALKHKFSKVSLGPLKLFKQTNKQTNRFKSK